MIQPSASVGAKRQRIKGNSDPDHFSTSYAELHTPCIGKSNYAIAGGCRWRLRIRASTKRRPEIMERRKQPMAEQSKHHQSRRERRRTHVR